ncbi:hypothetical protein ACRYGW_07635 [Mycobacteroides abscessus]
MTENNIELPGQPLTAAHRGYLHGAGLTDEYLDREGVLIRSVTGQFDLDTMPSKPFSYVTDFDSVAPRGLLFGSKHISGDRIRWRLRLDNPPRGSVSI